MAASQANLDVYRGDRSCLICHPVMPGLEIANYESNTEIYIRGIGSNANTELGDPAIAPHLDDVYVPRPRGLGVAFFDLERVEVNVGPRVRCAAGTPSAARSTWSPGSRTSAQFDAYAEFSVGDYDHQELRGALNIPIGWRLSQRAWPSTRPSTTNTSRTPDRSTACSAGNRRTTSVLACTSSSNRTTRSRCSCPATTSTRVARARAASISSTRRR